MGVSTLVGVADGTTAAAALYDRSTGWMLGPIVEAEDAYEQLEGFQQWLREHKWFSVAAEIFGRPDFVVYRHTAIDGSDVRGWTATGLEKLWLHWRRQNVGDDGWLLDPYECGCGTGHNHLGERGETARYGECSSCTCTNWKPGNPAAARAAEGE